MSSVDRYDCDPYLLGMFETAKIIPSRKLTRIMVNGTVRPLPEGSNDADIFRVVGPFVPFTDYVVGYHGPKESTLVVIVEILADESSSDTSKRLNALLARLG